jgi:two-component system OmpR family response regulator
MCVKYVLLVDDDPDIRHIGRLSLSAIGRWEVGVAGSGAEALQSARDRCPDCIVLDLQMQGLDGLQTLRLLRSQASLSEVPVVFLTGAAEQSEDELLAEGALGVLRKPFDPVALPGLLRDLLEGGEAP